MRRCGVIRTVINSRIFDGSIREAESRLGAAIDRLGDRQTAS
jgi:hypothetical protein